MRALCFQRRLTERQYTFLHGEKVTVLESELTALTLMQHVARRGIDLPVNYCSFVFKNRFQRAAARRRSALLMAKPHEDVTAGGYIRAICLVGDPPAIARLAERLAPGGLLVIGVGEVADWQHPLLQRVADEQVLAFTREG